MPEDRATNKKRRLWSSLFSFRTYVVIAFAIIAAATAVILVGATAFVFNIYFSSYTSENMETIAGYAAMRIAGEYEKTLSFNAIDYDSIIGGLQIDSDTGVTVIDNNDNVFYDNTKTTDGSEGGSGGGVDLSQATQVAVSSIVANETNVGSVRIWVYGSDAFMSKPDLEFRDNTLRALSLSAIVAILIAILIGFIFARILVNPINRVLRAAQQFADGNLNARTHMHGRNEIGRLGQTFDAMAESIEKDRQMELRLTSDVAHELRTPLMAIRATVEAMLDGVYEPDVKHLGLVNSEVRRLSRLVDALLKLSRLEHRSQPLSEEICDLGELCEDVVITHEVLVQESELTIRTQIDGVVKAICDRDLIRQAVANLISNAVRYTPEGGSIVVHVHEVYETNVVTILPNANKEDMRGVDRGTKENTWAVIDVTDTGIGLTPEEEKMVFSRFWRADSGRSASSGGLGIGLSVVKEIVSQHRGAIRVHGEKGVGSTFAIMLPAYDEERSKREARAAIKAFERRNRQQS